MLDQRDGIVPQILQRLNVDVEIAKSRVADALNADQPSRFAPNQGPTQQIYLTLG